MLIILKNHFAEIHYLNNDECYVTEKYGITTPFYWGNHFFCKKSLTIFVEKYSSIENHGYIFRKLNKGVEINRFSYYGEKAQIRLIDECDNNVYFYIKNDTNEENILCIPLLLIIFLLFKFIKSD